VENKGDVAFHAKELFHGTKAFHRDHWPLELRLEILDQLAIIPKQFDLPILFGTTDRKSFYETLPADASPILVESIAHARAFFNRVTQVETIMCATGEAEVAMLIVEDRERLRKTLKMSDEIFRGRASRRFQVLANAEPWLNRLFPVERNRHLPRAPPRQPSGTPRRARVPPVDYRDGLSPCCPFRRRAA
jgi:hypothetical protein